MPLFCYDIKMNEKHISGILYGIISALGVTGYVTVNKYVYSQFDVGAIQYTLVFAMIGAIYGLVSLKTKYDDEVARVIRKNATSLLILGLAVGLAVGILVFGQNYTTSINASLIVTSSIAMTTIFSYMILGEHPARKQVAWMVVLFAGLYLAIVGLHSVSFRAGDLIVLGSVLFFGFGNAYSRLIMKRMKRPDIVPDTRLIIAGGFATLLAPMFIRDYSVIVKILPLSFLAGAFYFLTMKTFAKSVYLLDANEAIVINQGQIFFTALSGVLILSEEYSLEKFIGSILVIVSIYFIATHRIKRPKSDQSV